MRYGLRTLLILLAIGPPLAAGVWWGYQREVERRRKADFDRLIELIETTVAPASWNGLPGRTDDYKQGLSIIPGTEQDIQPQE